MAHGNPPRLNRTRWDRTLAQPVGVCGGSPGLRRWSAIGANDEVDDGVSPSTGGSSWGASNRRRPSPPAAEGYGEIPAMLRSPCSGKKWEGSVRGVEWNGVKKTNGE